MVATSAIENPRRDAGGIMLHRLALISVIGLALTSAPSAISAADLEGAGATFPYPLYEQWFKAYSTLTQNTVSYEGVGSGEGVTAILDRSVDFGATDVFLDDGQLQSAGAPLIHIPTCLGAVAITYNLPGIPELRFTPDLIAAIFSGEVTRWNDRRIADVNPGLRFPDQAITVVHRTDASGTTHIFTDFLSGTSLRWREEVGTGNTVGWPVGQGAEGNAGLVDLVKGTEGSIGYVQYAYADAHEMPVAAIRNQAAYFIKPTVDSLTAAARVKLPDDARLMLTNTDAPDGYPITSFSYVVMWAEQKVAGQSRKDAEALVQLWWWAIHDGQALNEELGYAPLPRNAVIRAENALRMITYGGAPLNLN
jgi:phosphate transport system substrate-binding protein